MKRMMQLVLKVGSLSILLVWFSACGNQSDPSSNAVTNPGEVGVDEQALGLKSGHFYLNDLAYKWLIDHQMAPAGLDIQEVNYGDMFADHPNIGRRDTFSELVGTEIIDPEHETGTAAIGYREDLNNTEPYHGNCGSGNQVAVILKYVKEPNLYLRLQVSYPKSSGINQDTQMVTAAGAVHYMNESWGSARAGDNKVRLFWSNIRGLEFFAGLFNMAQKFYENNTLPKPKLTDLAKVNYPGQIFLHAGDLPGILACGGNLISDLTPIYIGGNPFINTPMTYLNCPSCPTWPIWVPNVLDSKEKLVQNEMDKSNRVSANYLGWVDTRGFNCGPGVRQARQDLSRRHGECSKAEDDVVAIGRRIRELRGFDMTQAQFARRIGVTQSDLSALGHGEKEPDFTVLLSISKESGKSVDWLLTG